MVVTCQIKIAVVCQIEHCVLIADSLINNLQSVMMQGVSHGNHSVTRESLVTAGAFQPEGHRILAAGSGLPQPILIKIRAAVKIVFSIVNAQRIGSSVKGKGCVLHSVGVSANSSAKKGAAADIILRAVEAQHHISPVALLIRYPKLHQCCAQVCNLRRQCAAGKGI